ncbi:DNA replication regulator sld2 [Penicillium diatomitis]|uniref:DNA replication regulator SLD2 n=1 Tax=Penicillium diatomitis TaxID=2819901 RepID=A0A9W9WLI6_9EURO|nr:DNA replication regulator sld2 [Penicillium diatomitis]KAJ5469675.1 DNA replication regulator sld2 [Penicillium diatomitis]
MDDHVLQSSADVASKALELRADLKTWEKAFAATHEGRKAGREDIKQHPVIASKYKEYGRLKALESTLSRRENRQGPVNSQSKKRAYGSPTGPETSQSITTPRKAAKGIFATPTNNRIRNVPQVDEFVSPATFRKLFSPSTHRQAAPVMSPLKAAIGPTPQRDGKALGLFDMLSESGGSRTTPSSKKQKEVLVAGFHTPSKDRLGNKLAGVPEENEEEEVEEEHARLSRTPASSTKQFYLANLFATPTTMRYAAMVEADDGLPGDGKVPLMSQGGPLPEPNASETPSFLRRMNFNRVAPPSANPETMALSPIAVRKPLKFAGKGLSHLVQGLREMEEDREDDEWDMLREIEAEQEAASFQVAQSQPVLQEGRPYKKKGQKRTTRRVIMRPVVTRAKKSNSAPMTTKEDSGSEEEEEDGEQEEVTVLETQLPTGSEVINDALDSDYEEVASLHTISGSDRGRAVSEDPGSDSDDDPDFGESSSTRPKSFSERLKEAVSMAEPTLKEVAAKAPPTQQKEEKTSKPRMIKANAQVHTNYRSLKIHHRGGTQGRGRFRRR